MEETLVGCPVNRLYALMLNRKPVGGALRPQGGGLLGRWAVVGGVDLDQREVLARSRPAAASADFTESGYHPEASRVLSVHDAVPTRMRPMPPVHPVAAALATRHARIP